MNSHEHIEQDGFEAQPMRYKMIDVLNKRSFLTNEGSSLQVLQSLHSIGPSREVLDADQSDERILVNGNMSPLNKYGPSELSVEERKEDAKKNVHEYLYKNDIDTDDVRLLLPERDYDTPLTVINLDKTTYTHDYTGLLVPGIRADMIYTYNPDIVMAARPADCPIAYVTAKTPHGEVTVLLHLATLGVASDYVSQAKAELDKLGVDWESVRVQLTPGGHAETYNYEDFPQYNPLEKFPHSEGLFLNVKEKVNKKGETVYDYDVDVAAEVYEQIVDKWEVTPYQVFSDITDTTSPTSGYSSNSRHFQDYEVDNDNTRDIVLAAREKLPMQNPEKPAPLEVLADIRSIRVKYLDFDSNEQIRTVEIHKDLVEDVKAFFEEALELKFPIQHVVKSSEDTYKWDDDKLMADNATTAFNYRLIKGTDRPSLHGLGRALDVNDALNPFIRYVDGEVFVDPPEAVYNPNIPGTLTADHPLVIFMKARGWEWGGDWLPESGRTDYQHFQKAAS